MMAKDREERQPNTAELVADLSRVLDPQVTDDERQEELAERVKELAPKRLA